MKKLTQSAVVLALSICTAHVHAVDLKSLRSIGTDLAKAASLSDEQIVEGSRDMMAQMDRQNQIAPAGSEYARRLVRLTQGLENEDGLKLNFAVYMLDEVNAFATPDGSIRVYKGLMDMMTDDELRGVIGHEIGHTKLGHSKSQMKNALLMSAGTKAAGVAGGSVGRPLRPTRRRSKPSRTPSSRKRTRPPPTTTVSTSCAGTGTTRPRWPRPSASWPRWAAAALPSCRAIRNPPPAPAGWKTGWRTGDRRPGADGGPCHAPPGRIPPSRHVTWTAWLSLPR